MSSHRSYLRKLALLDDEGRDRSGLRRALLGLTAPPAADANGLSVADSAEEVLKAVFNALSSCKPSIRLDLRYRHLLESG